jgi:glycosyltransferase involved in cell wall biosynthesis
LLAVTSEHVRPLVAINLCSIRPGQLAGPSVYAERLTERLIAHDEYRWLIYCHQDYVMPPAWTAAAAVRRVLTTLRRPLRIAFEQCVLPLHARRDRVDLLFSPNFVSPVWGAKRLVVTIHDMYYRAIPEVLPTWQRVYWQTFIPISARACDRVLSVSRFTATDIARYLPSVADRVRVTPLACAVEDPDARGEAVADLPPGFVLWVANVFGNKNPEAVCRAAAQLRSEQPDVAFVHVGTDLRGVFSASLAAHGVTDRVHRLGRVTAGQLRWLYRNALCVIQPSHYEGFGIPVLEAQQLGAPLICSDAGPLPEVAGDGALYFPPREPERLAAAIVQLKYDAALRSALIERGRRNAEGFDWKRTAAATLRAFGELFGPQE